LNQSVQSAKCLLLSGMRPYTGPRHEFNGDVSITISVRPGRIATSVFKTGPLSGLVRPDSAQSLKQQPRKQKVERKVGRVSEYRVDVVYATGRRNPSDERTMMQ
jgi:hypothetical protein